MKGLTTKEAEERLKKYGANKLSEKKKTSPLLIFAGQFKDAMVMILLAATVISIVMGEVYDAITIIVIVVLNALLGFIQEYRTEKTIEALKRIAAPTAHAYRDGKIQSVETEKLVRGDVVVLEAGDKIPADCKILSGMAVECDESMLTGESIPVSKSVSAISGNGLNQKGAVYMGTVMTKGHCEAEVIATGKATQMGMVSGMLTEIEEERTPLQKRLGELGKIIGISCIVICVLVSLCGILRGYEVFDMLFMGISLAVAAIPEGLPATVTICLALAVRRIYKQRALVNKLHSVETLGCTNVICTDKTGTLTMNKMTVMQVYTGESLHESARINKGAKADLLLLQCAKLCNNAVLDDKQCSGDPTEIALLDLARKNEVDTSKYKRISETPFDSNSRFMEVVVQGADGVRTAFMKGAPDVVLGKCTHIQTDNGVRHITLADKSSINEALDIMTGKALRTLAYAYRTGGGDYVFIGITGMNDPLRPEIKLAVKKCHRAGIKIVMLTGDHKNTALEIAKQAGIFRHGNEVCTGAELGSMNDDQLDKRLKNIAVFARVSPADKLRIVRAFKRQGAVVAMTGDGVNDAPAVKEASIGVAMGLQGTDVTKEAAQIVLLDDNFATLVSAVEQGRTIYGNIRKFIRYMLSCNIGEVFTMLFAMLFGMPVVLLPIQLLLINLVTDGLPAIALGMEPAEDKIMDMPPRKADESIFAGGMLFRIVMRGLFIGICTLAAFAVIYKCDGDIEAARTSALGTLGLSQLIFVFECKDESRGLFNAHYGNNVKLILAVLVSLGIMLLAVFSGWLAPVFQTKVLDWGDVFATVGFSAAIPVLVGIGKLFKKES